MSREEGTGVVERARGETVRRHGQQGGRRSRRYRHISDEIRITLIYHVRNHDLSFREAGGGGGGYYVKTLIKCCIMIVDSTDF